MVGNSALLKNVRDAAQTRIKAGAFADAGASKAEIEKIGGDIARLFGGVISAAPVKSQERAAEKVATDYAGDWHSVKDLARMTIVVPTAGDCRNVLWEIQKRFTASQGRGVLQVKDVLPSLDPCGCSNVPTIGH